MPPERLGAYLRDFRALLTAHGLRVTPYGHFGDGCIHVRIDFDHAEDGAWLEGPDGLAVPARIESDACAALAPEHVGETCIRIAPDGLLAPSAPYAIVLGLHALTVSNLLSTAPGKLAQETGVAESEVAFLQEQLFTLGLALDDRFLGRLTIWSLVAPGGSPS